MSYSFKVRGVDKGHTKDHVAAELLRVVATQPMHHRDSQLALAAATAFIDLIHDDATKDIGVTVSGSLGWNGSSPDEQITTGNVSVSVYLVDKDAA